MIPQDIPRPLAFGQFLGISSLRSHQTVTKHTKYQAPKWRYKNKFKNVIQPCFHVFCRHCTYFVHPCSYLSTPPKTISYIQIETTHIKFTVPGGDTRWTHLALSPRYLATVFEHLQAVLEDFRPELVLYDAGVETRAEGSWLVVQ